MTERIEIQMDAGAEDAFRAFHEACHVVVLWAQGLDVARVTIEAREANAMNRRSMTGMTAWDSVPAPDPARSIDAGVVGDVGTPSQAGRVSVAGEVGDRLSCIEVERAMGESMPCGGRVVFRPDPGESSRDLELATHYAKVELGPGATREGIAVLLNRWRGEAFAIITANLARVERLRDALIAERTLGRDRILAVLAE